MPSFSPPASLVWLRKSSSTQPPLWPECSGGPCPSSGPTKSSKESVPLKTCCTCTRVRDGGESLELHRNTASSHAQHTSCPLCCSVQVHQYATPTDRCTVRGRGHVGDRSQRERRPDWSPYTDMRHSSHRHAAKQPEYDYVNEKGIRKRNSYERPAYRTVFISRVTTWSRYCMYAATALLIYLL
jgi:hypothetical protein